jgi:hypothetical protein
MYIGFMRAAFAFLVGVLPLVITVRAGVIEAPSFRKEVLPLFAHHCFKCHGDEKQKGDLNFKSRASVFDRAEPILVPGKSAQSLVMKLVTSHDEEERMPPKGRPLNETEIATLRSWIDSGAPWEEADVNALSRKVDFRLAAPALPPGQGNPIDRFLAPYFARHEVDANRDVEDRLFARRAWFDVVGIAPPENELDAFLADGEPGKRTRLIDRLLSEHSGYAAHWISFWQDHLRDGTKGVDEAGNPLCLDHYHVRPITPWLHEALLNNKPYDVFVRELVCPPDLPRDPYADPKAFKNLPRDSSGFLQGIRIGGATPTAVQAAEVQAAQNIGQVFLGTQLKCATCHDSFVDGWKQTEVWALASVYAEKPLEIYKAENPTGEFSRAGFLFPELDRISPNAPVRERVAQLAESLTRPENGLFARTIVNRIWARLMGRGLVEPLDDMAEPAWHPELLDWVAADFIAHRYDLKHLIRQILTSRAWQMPAVAVSRTPENPFVFRGPWIRRLTAEQFADTLYALQGRPYRAWEQRASPLFDALGRPDRQLVATTRNHEATVLQSLEFLNGQNLHALLYQPDSSAAQPTMINERCPVTNRSIGPGTPRPNPRIILHDGLPIGVEDLASEQAFEREPAKYLPRLEGDIRVARVSQNRAAAISEGADLLTIAEQRFTRALSRPPTPRETGIMMSVFGTQPSRDDLADITWLTLMKPEFQLLQ